MFLAKNSALSGIASTFDDCKSASPNHFDVNGVWEAHTCISLQTGIHYFGCLIDLRNVKSAILELKKHKVEEFPLEHDLALHFQLWVYQDLNDLDEAGRSLVEHGRTWSNLVELEVKVFQLNGQSVTENSTLYETSILKLEVAKCFLFHVEKVDKR